MNAQEMKNKVSELNSIKQEKIDSAMQTYNDIMDRVNKKIKELEYLFDESNNDESLNMNAIFEKDEYFEVAMCLSYLTLSKERIIEIIIMKNIIIINIKLKKIHRIPGIIIKPQVHIQIILKTRQKHQAIIRERKLRINQKQSYQIEIKMKEIIIIKVMIFPINIVILVEQIIPLNL